MKIISFVLLTFQSITIFAQAPRLVVPRGHTEGITSVAFSRNGKYILSGSRDRTSILWDTTGHEIKIFPHKLSVKSVQFSADDKTIYTSSTDGHINEANLIEDSIQIVYSHNQYLKTSAISIIDQKIFIVSENSASFELRDFNGKLIKEYKHPKAVTAIALSSDSKYVLAASKDFSAILWQLSNNKKTIFSDKSPEGHKGEISSVCIAKDLNSIVTTSLDKGATLWNISGKKIYHIVHTASILCSDISSDNQTIATGSQDGMVKIWSKNGIKINFIAHKLAINAICFSPDGKSILTASDDKTICQWDLKGQLIKKYSNHVSPISYVNFMSDKKYAILTMNKNAVANIWNNIDFSFKSFRSIKSVNAPFVAIHPSGEFYMSGGDNGKLTGRNYFPLHPELKNKKDDTEININLNNQITSLSYSYDGKNILTGHLNAGGARLSDLEGKQLKVYKQNESIGNAIFSPSGKYMATSGFSENIITVFDLTKSEKPINRFSLPSRIISIIFINDSIICTGSQNGLIEKWNSFSGNLIGQLGIVNGVQVNALCYSSNNSLLASGDNAGLIKIWNLNSNNSFELKGHISRILSLNFSNKKDADLLISGSDDGTAKIWDLTNKNELITLFAIDSSDWAVVSPDGAFDASPGAMLNINFTSGLEVIELDQLKNNFYQPGLLGNKLGFLKSTMPIASLSNNLELYPEITANISGNNLKVKLNKKERSIGKLSLYIGIKEVNPDINPDRLEELKNIDLSIYSKYFYGDTMDLSLISYNKDSSLRSQNYHLNYYLTNNSKGGSLDINQTGPISFKGIPDLYALIIGTSNYSGEISRLVFPDKDAKSMAQGIKAVGNRIFKNVFLKLLTTDTQNKDSLSTKLNIEKAIKEFSEKASAKDVLLIYFSGHGSTYNDNGKSQFYYLTKDVVTSDLGNAKVRNNFAVSSNDLAKWLTSIAARKQVLIFDACHSGEVIGALESASRDISPSKIVALDRLKDRSGTFILTGSAGDKVSFESNQYGQGLLTYTLLQGMRGLALTQDKRVDVSTLFGFSKDQVPLLAQSINKIQIPIVSYPREGGSFDIGLVDTILPIPEVKSKPIFSRSKIASTNFGDPKKIVDGFAKFFGDFIAQGSNADLIYTELDVYPNAYSINGTYETIGNEIQLTFKLFRGDKELHSNKITVTSNLPAYTDLYAKAFEEIKSMIKPD
ncbi:MAG: caspase family protein [Saprospiraceae bacterium]